MSTLFYAVQHGDETDCSSGSEIMAEAFAIAEDFHEWFPEEEIRICVCTLDDNFCKKAIIVYEGER